MEKEHFLVVLRIGLLQIFNFHEVVLVALQVFLHFNFKLLILFVQLLLLLSTELVDLFLQLH